LSAAPPQQVDHLTWLIPILSLAIAALAVFVGPFITLKISRRQFELSRRIADKQIVAPMRQAWINNLREKVAELSSSALHYWNKDWSRPLHDSEDMKDEEQKRLTLLEHEIELLINPSEADHKELVETIRKMMWALERGLDSVEEFNVARKRTMILSQCIFKAEWKRIKEEIRKP
jgi:hypothetical protein